MSHPDVSETFACRNSPSSKTSDESHPKSHCRRLEGYIGVAGDELGITPPWKLG